MKHGGFKKSWHVGDELEIAWEDGKERLVYVCKDKVLKKKSMDSFLDRRDFVNTFIDDVV